MSKRHLRQDRTCLNCGNHVEKRFCGQCGQENTETRQSFGHLVKHFIEDITHYDGAFWPTMRFLLFRPAYLTKEYLKGRRSSYVPPVRLYIFISFVTFLLPYVLPDGENEAHAERAADIRAHDTIRDTIRRAPTEVTFELDPPAVNMPYVYKSVRELDSTQSLLPEEKRMSLTGHWLVSRYIHLQKYNKYELGERFFESFSHSFPKALFIYMPLFGLVLWLFHGKKRWLYFDHAIFTLHYFSFLLLVCNIMTLSDCFGFIDDLIAYQVFLFMIISLAVFVYFFIAHKRMYEESRAISFLKSFFIYSINMGIFIALLLALTFYSLLTIH